MKVLLLAIGLMFSTHAFAAPQTTFEKVMSQVMPMAHADAAVQAAPVVAPPESLEDAAKFIPTLIDAVKSSNWLLFGALIALIVTFVVRHYVLPKMNLGTGWLPWVSALTGLLAGVGGAVAAGAKFEAALMATLSGPVASLIWDAIIQYFAPEAPKP